MIRILYILLCTLAGLASPARAAALDVGYSGRLTDATGKPLEGPLDLEVRFYRSAGGNDQVGSTLTFAGTQLASGIFQLPLGLSAADAASVFGDGTQAVFVEVSAGGKAYPRQLFLAVPYALRVPVDGSTIGYNGSGQLAYVGSVGVTGVTASAPLTVGGSAAAPSLSLPAASGTQNGYLASADWTAFNGKQANLGYTPVNKAGDTMTGALSVIAPTAAGHATPKSYVDAMLGGFALDQSTKNDQYVVKWDTAAGKFVLGADQLGAAGGGIQSINTLNTTAQTLAVGTAGTAPAWVSATSTHTLNIPMASAAGVTAGLLAKTDYDAFTAKQPAISAASTVDTGTLTTALQNGVELKPFNTAAGNTGELRFAELTANGTDYVGFKAPDTVAAPKIWTLPAADGSNGQVLKTDGAGNLSWVAQPTAPVTTVNGQTGAVSLTTTNVAEGTNLYYTDTRARAAISGTAPINVSGAGAISLANTAVTPGSYTRATVTVDAQGRLTAAANGANVNLATETTGTLAVASGGTGATSFTNNGVVIGSGPSPLSATAAGTANQVLRIPSGGGAPAFGAIDVGQAAAVTGTLAIANGGTGQTTAAAALNALLPAQTAGKLLSTNGSSPAWLAYGTSGANSILQLDGAGKLPALDGSALTGVSGNALTIQGNAVLATAPTTGQVLTWNGSSWAPATPPHYGATCSLGSYITGFAADGTVVCSSGDNGFVKVSAGYVHTCAILSDYTVRCWGNGGNGRLGNKLTATSKKPVTVKTASGVLTNVIDIAAGFTHSCAIVGNAAPGTQGSVWCWGNNATGQLGDNTTVQKTYAVQAGTINNAVQIATGYYHTCARLADGTAKCWGNGGNYRLGTGAATNALAPATVLSAAATTMTNVAYISGGYATTCLAKTDGSAWCVGYNGYDQIGDGTATQRQYFVQPTGMSSGVTMIETSTDYNGTYVYGHTCAIKSGDLYCWGLGTSGQIGDGAVLTRAAPVQVTLADTDDDLAVDDPFTGVTNVKVGSFHTCAIAAPQNTVYCWGIGADYAVTHTSAANTTRPIKVRNADDSAPLTDAISLGVGSGASGTSYSTAIVNDTGVAANGVGLAWGDNSNGQLGDDSTNDTATNPPVYVTVP